MIRGNEIEEEVYEPGHIQQVLAEITGNFAGYFKGFSQHSLNAVFEEHIRDCEKEQEAYQDYLDLKALDEFEYDPSAFKDETQSRCPIIRRCLMSQDEVMKDYRRSFYAATGRKLLDTVRNIAEFGVSYVAHFHDETHEGAESYADLGLEPLNEVEYGCPGVIGYGVQASLLHGTYPRSFAHRSQNAVWSLYFLSGRNDFGLSDGSEFLMVRPKEGTCEQNFFYPAELFGFYALRLFLELKPACAEMGVTLEDRYRYVYLSSFCDHVADGHRDDINAYRWSSEHVESQPWF